MRLVPLRSLFALALSTCALSNASAQRLDPDFPASSASYVQDTAAAYLDLETQHLDRGGLLVPRTLGGGVSMTFTAREGEASIFPYYRVGLRRMFDTGASFGATVPTQVTTSTLEGIVDGVDPDGGVCLLIDSFSPVTIAGSTRMACFDDSGLDASNVGVGLPGDANQFGGGIRRLDGTMVIAGVFSTTAAPNTYKLFFERRFPVGGALFAPRVEHFLKFGSVLPVDTRLRVAALERDAQGRWLVAGHMLRANGTNQTEAFVARFDANFALDTTFGTQGLVDLGFGVGNRGAARYDAQATDLAILDSGTLVVVGTGCATSACGLSGGDGTYSKQPLTAIVSADGVRRAIASTFSGTDSSQFFIRVQPTRYPFVPRGAGAGFMLFEQYEDGANLVRTFTERSGLSQPVHSRIFALRYEASGTIIPQPVMADATSTRSSDRTRHYVAWTVQANNANPTDTDMVMGELQTLVPFGDGFE